MQTTTVTIRLEGKPYRVKVGPYSDADTIRFDAICKMAGAPVYSVRRESWNAHAAYYAASYDGGGSVYWSESTDEERANNARICRALERIRKLNRYL